MNKGQTDFSGSRRLLLEALETLSNEQRDQQLVSNALLAQAYEEYGLSDGSLKPLEEYGKLTVPTSDQLSESVSYIVRDNLTADDKWLLDIPIGVANMSSASAYVFVDDDRGAAIVLSSVLFGALYVANEIIEIAKERKSDSSVRTILGKDKNSEWALLFRDCLVEWSDASSDALVKFHDSTELSIPSKARVFKYTTVMQAFFLLHEFGHLALGHFDDGEEISLGIHRFAFHGRNLELQADHWACLRILRGINNVSRESFSPILEGTVRCFAFFEFLRQRGWFPQDKEYPSPYARWEQVQGWIDPTQTGRPKSHFWYRSGAKLVKKYINSYFESLESNDDSIKQ
jgi:hypothetical protein